MASGWPHFSCPAGRFESGADNHESVANLMVT
jgi:hypothetical protein